MEKINWKTVEHIYIEKSVDWYWIVGIVAVSLAFISIILNNLIFGILIIVSALTLALFASKPPRKINVEISEKEISIGEHKHMYSELTSFWIETRDGVPRLLLKSKKLLSPLISVFIENQDPEKIENLLSKKLEKEELSEPFLEKVMIYLGF